jgi:hypothetical protein
MAEMEKQVERGGPQVKFVFKRVSYMVVIREGNEYVFHYIMLRSFDYSAISTRFVY